MNEEEHHYSETVNQGGRRGTLISLPAATTVSQYLPIPMLVSHEIQNLHHLQIEVGDWDGASAVYTQLDLIMRVYVTEGHDASQRPPIHYLTNLQNAGIFKDG